MLKKKKFFKKMTSAVLATCMILSLNPAGLAFADEPSQTEITTEATEESTEETIEKDVQLENSSTEETTEAVTEKTTNTVTEEETTEAVTEENKDLTEIGTDEEEANETDDINTNESEEEKEESLIVFDHYYSNADTSVVNTKELFVEADDASVFTKNTTVESNYDNVYIISFDTVEEARYAFSYYFDKVSFISDLSSVVTLTEEESTETDAEDIADLSEVNEGSDAIANLNDLTVNNYNGYIALIDSGVSEADAKMSVIGDDGNDKIGHGTKMYNYIKEENPDAKILSIKAFDNNKTNIADVYAAIKVAIEAKVSVINLSFVALYNENNEILADVIQEARDNGIIVIGAAGNYSDDANRYIPGGLSDVTCVGAVNEDGTLYKTSNYNADLYVIATSTSEATARYTGIFTSGKDSDKVFEKIITESDEENDNTIADDEVVLQSGYNATKAAEWWSGQDKTSFPQTMTTTVTITGNATGATPIQELGVTTGEPDNWSSLVPGYNWATTWYIGTDTLKSNLTSAVSYGALYKGDGTAASFGHSTGSNTYYWWGCIDAGQAYPSISGGSESANIGFVKLNDEIRYFDGVPYEYAYYGATWDTPGGTQSFCIICGFWKQAPVPWRRFIKIKKVNYLGQDVGITGCDIDVYTADNKTKLGDMTDNGDGTYSWHTDWMTTDSNIYVSIYEVTGGGIYNNSRNNGKWLHTFVETGYEYQNDQYAVYPISYTDPQEWWAYLRVKKESEHASLYNNNDYSYNGATFAVYRSMTDAQNNNNSIGTLVTKNIGGVDGLTDWLNVTSYMNVVNGAPQATTFYAKETSASKGYYPSSDIKAITVNPYSSSEVTYTWNEPEEAYLYLKKASSNKDCSNGNPNYDLTGATYKVYRSETAANTALRTGDYSTALMTFTCDANGDTVKQKIDRSYLNDSSNGGISNTEFYAVESAAGAKGYTRSNSVTKVTVTPTNDINHPALIDVKDTPVDDPVNLTVNKEDSLYGTVKALEGVEFKISFYAQDISTIRSAAYLKAHYTADWTGTYITNQNGKINFSRTFPRGFVVVEEISNPDNYTMDDLHVYLNGDKNKEITENLVLVTDAILKDNDTAYDRVTWYPNNASTYAELATKGTKITDATFSFLVTNRPKRGNIQLEKMDETTNEPMAHVKFRITNLDTKEVHYIYTDENGKATTKVNSYGNHVNYYDDKDDYDGTDDATVWFAKFEDKTADANDDYAALSCGNYEIKEMRCAANEGYQLDPAIEFTISEDEQLITIADGKATENENKLWNTVKPTIGTTAIVKYSDEDTNTDNKTLAQQGTEVDVDWTNQTIIDTVHFDKLRADTTYTLLAELMILDREGNVTPYLEGDTDTPYKRVKTFTTTDEYKKSIYEISDDIVMELDSVNPTGLEEQQKKLVVYETLYYGKYDTVDKIPEGDDIITRYENYDEDDDMDFFPVEHKDKNDTFQTVTPGDIHTTVKDNVSGDKIAHTSETTTLTDSVFYTGLTVGEEYTIEGTLQIKEGTDWSTITYDPKNPDADEDGYVYGKEQDSTNNNEGTDANNTENLPDTEDEEFNNNPNKAYTLRDADGNPVTASRTFVAEQSEGYIDIEFTFDSSLLEGKSVVAFEKLKYKDNIIATHNDLHDEDETVHYPTFGTTTKNSKIDVVYEGSEDSSKEVAALAEGESFTDTIHFSNLLANRKYIAKGTLMDKETGEPLKDATGKIITAECEFETNDVAEIEMTQSPDAFNFTTEDGILLDLASDHANYLCAGDVDVVFTGYDFTNLANKTGTVFEEIYLVKEEASTDYEDGKASSRMEVLIGEHKDITDVDQFIYFIEVHTNATDKETEIPLVPQDKQTTILDTVTYKHAIPGKKYKLTATLKVTGDKSGKYKDGDTLLDKDGKPVTVDYEFTPKKADGEEVVEIPFDTTNLRNMNIVVFEDLYNLYGIKVAAHNDLTDENQTVRVPDGGTTAKDKATGDSVAQADTNITLVDTVAYENLVPNKKYTVTGTIYSKETKKPIQVNGVDFTKTVEFTPTEPNGTVDVVFEFSTRALKGATLVVFEDVKYENESVFIHADINDENQTVKIPEIGTTATVGNGQKSIQASKKITIVDRVEYKNLVIGKEYTVSGVLWNKATSEKLVVNGKNVTASKTFTAEKSDGYIDLEFTFDATGFSGDIVVGETLKHNDIDVATHTDLTDEGQTVTVTPPTTPPKTGMTIFFVILGLMAAGGAGMLITKKRKSNTAK